MAFLRSEGVRLNDRGSYLLAIPLPLSLALARLHV